MDAEPSALDQLATWPEPLGAPPLDRVRPELFPPAIAAAMEENRRELAAIVANPDPPDFGNTLAALEDSGRALGRVSSLFGIWSSARNDQAMQAVEREMAPVFAAFADEIVHDEALFGRIGAVNGLRAGLAPEASRLTEVVHRRFARHGAGLASADKTELAGINQRLAALATRFAQNLLGDEEEHALVLESEADTAGLPASFVAAAELAARDRGLERGWAIANTRSAMELFLTRSVRRDLRERAWRLWTSRGDGPGAHDNKPIIVEILALRARKARLLGFPSFADWVAADQMAGEPQAALDLMLSLWEPAKAQAAEDVASMQEIAQAENPGLIIAPWDHRYFAEKLRQARYDLEEGEIAPYLQLESLREAMFWVAERLFGLDFAERAEVPLYEPSMRAWEVRRDGASAGLFYFDPYARPGKSSGAWMSEYRRQERFAGAVTPIVSNNANFTPPPPGEPVLVSFDDARTLFHEFGHGLHGLLSDVAYPSLSGTSVARDFVEFPSQLNERWLMTPEVLGQFCRHYRTGEPMPAGLIERLERARTFNKGFETVEYLASAILDMRAHLAAEPPDDPAAFETEALAELGMPPEIVMRHRLPQFAHIFAGESYAAGYYDYVWADALTADAAEAFRESPGGFFDAELAARLENEILKVGDTVDAAVAFRRFRGRDVNPSALMRDRGFA